MKIKEITINNYRAFYGEYIIDLGDGNNAMFYGENGSGKSSLYKALATFFQAADEVVSIEENIFLDAGNEETASIKLTFISDDLPLPKDVVLDFPDRKILSAIQPKISDANKARGFLDYRILLRTHLDHKGKVNLFSFFMEDILLYFTNRFSKTRKTFKENWFDDIVYKTFELRQGNNVQKQIERSLDIYNKGVTELLSRIETDTNTFMKYFVTDISIELSFTGVSYHGRRDLRDKVIKLNVDFHNRRIEEHQEFLNEARLSALAISIYLAALKANPTVNVYKILFLDDVFVGLDMSNRIPLLKILKESFSDYQVFITSYDRNWFELAKKWLKNHDETNWSYFEMYASKDLKTEKPKPRLIKGKDAYEKAKDHLAAHDYPAAANYLRQYVENRLKEILPENYRKKKKKHEDEEGNPILDIHGTPIETIIDIRMAGGLLEKLEKYFKDIGVSYDDFKDIKMYKDLLLNPLSHDNITTPYYRNEVEEAIKAIIPLKEFKHDIILEVEEILTYRVSNADNTSFWEFDIKLVEPLKLFKTTTSDSLYSNPKCVIIKQNDGETETEPNWSNKLRNFVKFAYNRFNQTENLEPDYNEVIKFRGNTIQSLKSY